MGEDGVRSRSLERWNRRRRERDEGYESWWEHAKNSANDDGNDGFGFVSGCLL